MHVRGSTLTSLDESKFRKPCIGRCDINISDFYKKKYWKTSQYYLWQYRQRPAHTKIRVMQPRLSPYVSITVLWGSDRVRWTVLQSNLTKFCASKASTPVPPGGVNCEYSSAAVKAALVHTSAALNTYSSVTWREHVHIQLYDNIQQTRTVI